MSFLLLHLSIPLFTHFIPRHTPNNDTQVQREGVGFAKDLTQTKPLSIQETGSNPCECWLFVYISGTRCIIGAQKLFLGGHISQSHYFSFFGRAPKDGAPVFWLIQTTYHIVCFQGFKDQVQGNPIIQWITSEGQVGLERA